MGDVRREVRGVEDFNGLTSTPTVPELQTGTELGWLQEETQQSM